MAAPGAAIGTPVSGALRDDGGVAGRDEPGAGAGWPDGAVTAFFAGSPLGLASCRAVGEALAGLGPVEVRVGRSQVAFRRRRGFAYLWRPDRWLRGPVAEVVLSIALERADPSPRWKQVAHPSPRIWMHHLELRSVDDVDDQVRTWLAEAYEAAGSTSSASR